MILYKYLPDQYVKSVLDGNILFRNLVYFKKLESDPRSDISEGTHIDSPDNDVVLTNVSTGKSFKGKFAFHNTLANPDRLFCFCTSMRRNTELEKFGNACIEFHDFDEFNRRLERALKRRSRLTPLEKPILAADSVKYYARNQVAPTGVDIKNPRHLPFLKGVEFEAESEFRFAFAARHGYELTQKIVATDYREQDDFVNKEEKQIVIRIDSIKDIARSIGS